MYIVFTLETLSFGMYFWDKQFIYVLKYKTYRRVTNCY